MIDKRTSLTISVVGWALMVISLAGCGAGATTPVATQAVTARPPTQAFVSVSTQPALDPCKVLAQGDVTTFLGAPSDAGRPSSGGSTASFCIYSTADSAGHLSINLNYETGSALKSDDFAQLQPANQNVPGLGEGAYFDSTIGQLTIAKGSWVMRLSGSAQGKLATLDSLKRLAQSALGQLP